MKGWSSNEEETSLYYSLYRIQERYPSGTHGEPHYLKEANNKTEGQETVRQWSLYMDLKVKFSG